MPKKNEQLEVVAPKTEQVAIYDPGLAVGDEAGMDNITSQDVKLPFLAIAQKTSKVLDRSEGKYIEGLEFGDMYDSEELKSLGTGPIEFLPVLVGKRARLKGENGKLGDVIPWDDPRCIPPWEPGSPYTNIKDVEGVRIYDWAAVLLPSMDKIVISFKSTSFTAGKSLNTALDKHRKLARLAQKGFRTFQVKCAISTFIDKNEGGAYGKFKVVYAGSPNELEYRYADAWFEAIKDKVVVPDEAEDDVIDAEPEPSGKTASDVPF